MKPGRARAAREVMRLCLWLAVCAQAALAQESEPQADDGPAETQPTQDAEGGSLIPLPVVFYQPETGFGFGVTAVKYAGMTAGDTISPPSSFALIGIYTTKSQLILGLRGDMYFGEDRWRLVTALGYSRFPTKYWGIGNDTPDSAEVNYTPAAVSLRLWPQKRIGEGWYAGLAANLLDREIKEVADTNSFEAGEAPGAEDEQLLGIGGSLVRDTRDSTVFPRGGYYHQLLVDLFTDVWFGDSGFGLYTLDLRAYFPLAHTHVLALRALGMASSGEPPFDQYPQLGGESLLRGYYQGRYRDRTLIAFQAEYRFRLFWRLGAAGFAGAGQVAPNIGGLGLDRFWLSGGAGLRFLLARKEGLNVRMDFAIAEGSTGFYLSFGEAF